MRALSLTVLAIGAAAILGSVSAQAGDHPFCIKSPEYLAPLGYCAFDTYQQCKDTASGRYASCDTNPFYVGRVTERTRRVRRKHHHSY
jgi:hypothetical protein